MRVVTLALKGVVLSAIGTALLVVAVGFGEALQVGGYSNPSWESLSVVR